jgi:hypothetical protein
MAIHVNTDDSQGLLDSIYAAIDEGSIVTWAYDGDMDFIHDTADGQWKGEAWLHPTVGKGVLVLNVIPPKKGVSKEAYAVYHGRFIEMLLAHFDEQFSQAVGTAKATAGDHVN